MNDTARTPSTDIQEYRPLEAQLSDLITSYQGVVFDCTTAEGYGAADAARLAVKRVRTAIERTRRKIKEAPFKLCQLIDSEAKRLTETLQGLEDPIVAQIAAEDQRRAQVEAEERKKAQQHIANWRARIYATSRRPLDFINAGPDAIREAIGRAEAVSTDGCPEELLPSLRDALDDAIRQLQELLGAAIQREQQRARLAELEDERAAAEPEPESEPEPEPATPPAEPEPGPEPAPAPLPPPESGEAGGIGEEAEEAPEAASDPGASPAPACAPAAEPESPPSPAVIAGAGEGGDYFELLDAHERLLTASKDAYFLLTSHSEFKQDKVTKRLAATLHYCGAL